MEVPKNLTELLAALFQQGFIDDQFLQLHQLQDESNPEFLAEIVALYFEDSERIIDELVKAISQDNVDFKAVDAYVHQLKGSSASLGVLRMKNCCAAFRSICDGGNSQGCWQALQQLKQEYILLKHKLEQIFCSNSFPWELSSQDLLANGNRIEEPFIPETAISQQLVMDKGETMTS